MTDILITLTQDVMSGIRPGLSVAHLTDVSIKFSLFFVLRKFDLNLKYFEDLLSSPGPFILI